MSASRYISWADWCQAVARLRSDSPHSQILGGSLVMLIGSTLVSAVNFAYNVAVARLLGPPGFGQAAAAVTLLMLMSAITLAFQLVCAKLIARTETPAARAAVYRLILRRAWMVGILLGSALLLLSENVASYLRLSSPHLLTLLAAGAAFYIPLGVKRGGFQGVYAFSRLSANFILEALTKFTGAIVLVMLGYGVIGAVAAIAGSVVLAYFLPATPRELRAASQPASTAIFSEAFQAIVFFVGQVTINNIDILLVKHFFAAADAGFYAAIALVGRVVYMLSWSVVSAMFPISAAGNKERENASVLVVPLIIVVAITVAFTVGLGLFPDFALRTIFGSGFVGYGFEALLMLYAAATGVYSLAVVLLAYEMSRRITNTSWIQLAFSAAIVAGIHFFHSSLREVVIVQLVLMVLLLISVSVSFFRRQPRLVAATVEPVLACAGLRRIRRISEAEIIAKFLQNEFHHAEFDPDRDRFAHLVMDPNTADPADNALRRALLFRRRGTMWRELPPGTEWWEVALAPHAIERLRVFPRAQWRKLASGSFVLSDIVARIRSNGFAGRTAAFIDTIKRFSRELHSQAPNNAILLIGIDEIQPLTILEGNHRLTAAMLASPDMARRHFRFYCGFSSRMTECCWYQTNLATLYRYARNRLKILMYDREADVVELLPSPTAALINSPGAAAVPPDAEVETRQPS
ncbi:MAG: hypothetical protein ACE14L_05800 [Terriglobales bacterium]